MNSLAAVTFTAARPLSWISGLRRTSDAVSACGEFVGGALRLASKFPWMRCPAGPRSC